MKITLAVTVVTGLALSGVAPAAMAQEARPLLRDVSMIQTAVRAAPRQKGPEERARPSAFLQTAPTTPGGSWPGRHPVLLGTLIGFGVGFAIGDATCRYPTAEGDSCSDYTYPGNARLLGGWTIGGCGAAIGAGVGAIIALWRK
jgi:hypothetical protein